MPRWSLVIVLALTAASCRAPVKAVLGTPVVLPVGQTATFGRSDLDLRFKRVASDSRCPTGATCVWAGEAAVTVEARILKGPVETFDIRMPAGNAPDSAVWKPYDAYRIRVVRLDPHPVVHLAVDTTRYAATFLVEKR